MALLHKWCTNNDELQNMINIQEDRKNDENGTKNHEDESSFSNFQLGGKPDDLKVKTV